MDAFFDSTQFHPSFTNDLDSFHSDLFNHSFSHFSQFAHDYNLPADTVEQAMHSTWEFLGMGDIPYTDASQTCIFTNNPYTTADDIVGINTEQLKDLGIHDEQSLSLVCTHEAGHCLTQLMASSGALSAWEGELASDALMGFRAAAENIDTSVIEHTFTPEDTATHPGQDLRQQYVEVGKNIWHEMDEQNLTPSLDNFFSKLQEHLQTDSETIHQREDSFSNNSDYDHDTNAKGFVNDKEWHEKEARAANRTVEYEHKEAEAAERRGDYSSMKEHLSRAKSAESTVRDHLDAAKRSTK